MKKIMFNDQHGLTLSVLLGRKKQTRRLLKLSLSGKVAVRYSSEKTARDKKYLIAKYSRYDVGEEVAVAQAYKNCMLTYDISMKLTEDPDYFKTSAGWDNKMYVKAEYMPHRIKIRKVRIERLQDISEEDCLKEGIEFDKTKQSYSFAGSRQYGSAKQAYAALIDKVQGKGTWSSNPFVIVYDFKTTR